MGTDGRHQHGVDPKTLKVVGQPYRKVDARSKVTGKTLFADDIVLPRMLHMKLLRSTEAHALIKSIDVSAAEKMPGVHAILLGAELPNAFGILPISEDEHALCIDKVRMVGDPVAAVAAVDEE
ncbi:MAG: aldehyde oxidase, partial [Planctomycetota bacterium]